MLKIVQSFGTEGRKANLSEEIPTSDNIFDYVVFRGSDIKDLQVFEAPPSYKPAVSAVEPTVIQDTNSNMMVRKKERRDKSLIIGTLLITILIK